VLKERRAVVEFGWSSSEGRLEEDVGRIGRGRASDSSLLIFVLCL